MKVGNLFAALLMFTAATTYPSLPANADKVRDAQWFTRYLDLARAHQITKGSGISVAIVDSGVTPHVDFSQNILKGTDTVPGGNGTGEVDDKDGHGTKMAGLIAGHGHGSTDGVIGVAPSARIIPIKAVGPTDNGQGVVSGIEWAVKSSADVINLSVIIPQSRALSQSIDDAIRSDSVVIAGAGNKTESPRVGYPAALPGVLAVGAVDQNGKRADFSVTGPEIGICAPGVDMVTTIKRNEYYKGSGTSEAAAVVSGAAALVRAKFPELSAAEVVHRLTATADDNGPPGRDEQCGYGVLNVVKALTADVPPLNPSGNGGSASPTPASSVEGSAPSGAGASPAVAAPEPAGSNLPLLAGIGAAVVALGTVLAFLVRRRRRGSS